MSLKALLLIALSIFVVVLAKFYCVVFVDNSTCLVPSWHVHIIMIDSLYTVALYHPTNSHY